jgi:amidase
MVSAEWTELIQKKRTTRDALIPKEWRLPESILSKVSETSSYSAFELFSESALLTPEEIDITESYTATRLVAKLAKGELSSYDVAYAFCKRAAIAHQLVSFMSFPFRLARWAGSLILGIVLGWSISADCAP